MTPTSTTLVQLGSSILHAFFLPLLASCVIEDRPINHWDLGKQQAVSQGVLGFSRTENFHSEKAINRPAKWLTATAAQVMDGASKRRPEPWN
jgi:hypothetical protein